MDVVIPVRERSHSDHLRFVLRSIQENFDVGQVIILGGRPEWLSRFAAHLPTVQDGDKFQNQATAMQLACETDWISDPFVWWCDDHYLLTPAEVPRVGRSDWDLARGSYAQRMTETRRLLTDLGLPSRNYELHLPMVIDKTNMLHALNLGGDMRTVYGNLTEYAATDIPDVKLRSVNAPWPDGPWVSTNAMTYRHHHARLDHLFRNPSIYEKR